MAVKNYKVDAFGPYTQTGTSVNSRFPVLPPSEKGIVVCATDKNGVAKDEVIQLTSGDIDEFVEKVGSAVEAPDGFYCVKAFLANGGRYLDVVCPTSAGDTLTVAEATTDAAQDAVELSDASILMVPKPSTWTSDGYGGNDAQDVDKVWIDFVDTLKDGRMFYVFGVPQALTIADAIDYIVDGTTGVNRSSQQAACYFPNSNVPAVGGGVKLVDICGSVGGLWARVSRDHPQEVAKAPAGSIATWHLKGISSLEQDLFKRSDTIKASLQNALINPVFSDGGIYVFGASTMLDDVDDVFRHINIARLHTYIRQQCHLLANAFIFEGFNDFTRDSLETKIKAFGQSMIDRQMLALGGFSSGVAFDDLFFVRVKQNEVNLSEVDVQVGYAPVFPIEFIVFTVTAQVA